MAQPGETVAPQIPIQGGGNGPISKQVAGAVLAGVKESTHGPGTQAESPSNDQTTAEQSSPSLGSSAAANTSMVLAPWNRALMVKRLTARVAWREVRSKLLDLGVVSMKWAIVSDDKSLLLCSSIEECNRIVQAWGECGLEDSVVLSVWNAEFHVEDNIACRNEWVEVEGLPFYLWTDECFMKIGDMCGGLLTVHTETIQRTNLRHIKVKVRGGVNGFISTTRELMVGGKVWRLSFRKGVYRGWRVVGDGRSSDPAIPTESRLEGGLEKEVVVEPPDTSPTPHGDGSGLDRSEPAIEVGLAQVEEPRVTVQEASPSSVPSRLQELGVVPKSSNEFSATEVSSMGASGGQAGPTGATNPVLRSRDIVEDDDVDVPMELHDVAQVDLEAMEVTARVAETQGDEMDCQADFVEDGAVMRESDTSSSDEEECGASVQGEKQDMEESLDGLESLFAPDDAEEHTTREVTNIDSHFSNNFCLPNVCDRKGAMESIIVGPGSDQGVQMVDEVVVVEGGREVRLTEFLDQMGLSLVKRDVRNQEGIDAMIRQRKATERERRRLESSINYEARRSRLGRFCSQ